MILWRKRCSFCWTFHPFGWHFQQLHTLEKVMHVYVCYNSFHRICNYMWSTMCSSACRSLVAWKNNSHQYLEHLQWCCLYSSYYRCIFPLGLQKIYFKKIIFIWQTSVSILWLHVWHLGNRMKQTDPSGKVKLFAYCINRVNIRWNTNE